MERSQGLAFASTLTILCGLSLSLCLGQTPANSTQADPNISGTGVAGQIPVWKSSTALGNSVLTQSAGNVGVGTKTPAAKLEVNGDAQVDGNFSLPTWTFKTISQALATLKYRWFPGSESNSQARWESLGLASFHQRKTCVSSSSFI